MRSHCDLERGRADSTRPVFTFKVATMILETEGSSAEAPEAGASTTTSDISEGRGYSVTDPGYEADGQESSENDLEQLITENKTKNNPSDTSDDASEADGETEETAETPTKVESAKSNEISDELLDRAAELGYTLDEIKSFRSGKSLEKEITRVETLQKRMQQRQSGKQSAQESPATETSEVEPEPNWEELIEVGHDPDVIAMQKQMWQRATKAEAMVKQIVQAEQDRAWSAQSQRFDDSLNNLGEEYRAILGTGTRGNLAKSSPEAAANRDLVFEKMQILKNGYMQAGKPMPTENDLIQEAVQASFYKQAQTIARKALTSEIKKSGSQALSRPRSAGNKSLAGSDLAMAKERAFWKSRGE